MLEALFGADMPLPVRFFLAFLIVVGLIGATAWAVRGFGAGRLGGAGTRGRQPRLAVVDYASVDSRRRFILVRRDNIEHLVLIGGPTDVVVEANIVRAAPATRRSPPAAETLPRATPLPENGNGSWPLRPEPMGHVPRMEPDEQVNWPMPQRGEGPWRPARETLAAIAEEMNRLGGAALVQPNHEGSRTANQVPKLDQSRACRRYNRIRRRLLQPIKTSRKWRVVSKRRYAHVAKGARRRRSLHRRRPYLRTASTQRQQRPRQSRRAPHGRPNKSPPR
jgi:Flagellar biosynthesis protein, FliO